MLKEDSILKRSKIISFGVQKGGSGKTTTSSIVSWLLARDSKVLAVDFDSQGNMTQMLTQRNVYDFTTRTALEACKAGDARPYIFQITENLHILPAEDFLSQLPTYLHREYNGSIALVLKKALEKVEEDYDYIIIDLPPNLGELTLNGLAASDYVVAMMQTEPFCFDAVDRFIEFLGGIKERVNHDLVLLGILPSMLNPRGKKDNEIMEAAKEDFGPIIFDTVIKRVSKIREFCDEGIKDTTKQDKEALEKFEEFIKEVKKRVHQIEA